MYRILISCLVAPSVIACRPARPLMVENKEGRYYFQDHQTGRIVGGPYKSTYENPEPDPPKLLPRKMLIEARDSTRHGLPWLINAWGQQTVRAFYFDNGPDYIQQGLMRYTNDSAQVGFANRRGRIKIPARFTIAYPFKRGYSMVGEGNHLTSQFPGDMEHMVWRGGKWGIINRKGRIVVPVQYDALNYVRERGRWLEAVRGSERFLITFTGRRLSSRPYSTDVHLPDTTGTKRQWKIDDQKGWGEW